jgi:hypothetical protein
MKSEIKYIELKSGFTHNGPAWIGLVTFSKTGKTIYFDGKAFQRIGSARSRGNFYDIETGQEYWISGVKKKMTDRHEFGNGSILVEKRILKEYLEIVGKSELPKSNYQITEVETRIPIERINELENEVIEKNEFDDDLHFKKPNELSIEEIEFVIEELIESEKESRFNKGRRFAKQKRLILEEELKKRELKTLGNSK